MWLSFGTLGREYINQIEMIQYSVVKYIFKDCTFIGTDKNQSDTSRTTIFAGPIKTLDSWHTFIDLFTKIVICF